MTEAEYIDATNLAKLRIAKDALKDLCVVDLEERAIRGVIAQLTNIEIALQDRIGHVT